MGCIQSTAQFIALMKKSDANLEVAIDNVDGELLDHVFSVLLERWDTITTSTLNGHGLYLNACFKFTPSLNSLHLGNDVIGWITRHECLSSLLSTIITVARAQYLSTTPSTRTAATANILSSLAIELNTIAKLQSKCLASSVSLSDIPSGTTDFHRELDSIPSAVQFQLQRKMVLSALVIFTVSIPFC